jgi:two-component system response regulator NreC
MKILVIDEHVIIRDGLVSLISSQPDMKVVGDAGTGSEAISKALLLKPDVLLLDISLPDISGFKVARAIHEQAPDIKIIFLTLTDSDDSLFEAIHCGASGYLLKNIPTQKLMTAIRSLEKGEAALSRIMMNRVLKRMSRMIPENELPADVRGFTQREIEILRLIGQCASNKQIAEMLCVSENTIKVHVHNILKKLGLRKRQEVANYVAKWKNLHQ